MHGTEFGSMDVQQHSADHFRHLFGKNYGDIPCRVVQWPEGAPPREEVPHAGSRVVLPGATRMTVITGVPFKYNNNWSLLCVRDIASKHPAIYNLSRLSSIPPKPETVTVDRAELESLRARIDELTNT